MNRNWVGRRRAGVWQRTSGCAGSGDPVDQINGLVVERDHPFGVELPERNLQPGTVPGDFVDAVEFEVQQFTDAKPDGAGEQQGVGGETIFGVLEGDRQPAVGVDGDVTRRAAGAGAGGRTGRSIAAAAHRSSPIR